MRRWAKTAAGSALYHVKQLKAKNKDKPVIVAEIGWPTASGPRDINTGGKIEAMEFMTQWIKARV